MRWLKNLPAKLLEAVLGGLLLLAVLAASDHYQDHVSLRARTWAFGAGLLGVIAVAAGVTLWIARRGSWAGEAAEESTEELKTLRLLSERYEGYTEHLRQILEVLQQVIAGEVAGVTYAAFIERGILEPARDMLKQDPGEDIRLSVLEPDSSAPDHFRMLFAAGHTVLGKTNYRIKIADSISRFAFERSKVFMWTDLREEPSYQTHPKASRPYRSMISLPIRSGAQVVGVFNVISTLESAFGIADIDYIKMLGSVINVAASLGLAEDLMPGSPPDA
ncbi:MAG: hypothetical protein QOH12_296 [Solirubrobacteraceae bacterium]|jgi:GAF domain-containing protein|nr:hypothetical protein [Solirubrobacteraceae bacterium]